MARIGLVAHDDKKDDLVAWANKHRHKLGEHELWGTGTTGGRVTEGTGLQVTRLLSGPLGGDAQIGASFIFRRVRVSYTHVMRTKEYYGQEDGDIFGVLSLTARF